MESLIRHCVAALRAFARSQHGNIVITFAIASPVVIGVTAIGVDYAWMSRQRTQMQAAADGAALGAARELLLARSTGSDVAAIARNYAQAALASTSVGGIAQIAASVIDNNTAVSVAITAAVNPVLGRWGPAIAAQLSVQAIARSVGNWPICLVALDEAAGGTLYLEAYARLTATNCAVYSNSKSTQGIMSVQSAYLSSALTCSAGGKVGSKINFDPMPITDCPVMPDPLAARPPPPVDACYASDKVVDGLTVTLNPGTYCGGLTVTGGARVTLSPGVYVIKDGPLTVDGGSTFQGTNVGFYLVGIKSTLLLANDTTINLTAPKDGALAGMLLFEDRAAPLLRQHKILSDNARTLLGTIYVPRGRLIVDASKPIADKSAYTIIVTRRMELYAGPNLVMNTDYGATDVPVPKGVGIVSDTVVLAQ